MKTVSKEKQRSSSVDSPVLAVEGVSKSFGETRALRDVDMQFFGGQVHAILGLNGAGKSTLMKVLSGAIQPDEGKIFLSGQLQNWASPDQARANGVSIVYQELSLCGDLSVAENIFLQDLPIRGRWLRSVDWKAVKDEARNILAGMGTKISVDRVTDSLSIAQQQMVEIAKALRQQSQVLILDEPTSALAQSETLTLFQLIRQLKERGVAIIYITHRLDELPQIADCVTVMREGQRIGTYPVLEQHQEELVTLMLGDRLHRTTGTRNKAEPGASPRLELRDVVLTEESSPISLVVERGEVVALSGQTGSGRSHLIKTIFGLHRPLSGSILFDGQPMSRNHQVNIQRGVGFIPEDRKLQGLLPGRSVWENIVLAGYQCSRLGWYYLSLKSDVTRAREAIKATHLQPSDPYRPVETLSGGNQQKSLLGRWYALPGLKLLLLDEPTRGVDVGARHQIYQLLHDLADQGLAILAVSSDAEEILELCTRVLILRDRAISGEYMVADLDDYSLNNHIIGG